MITIPELTARIVCNDIHELRHRYVFAVENNVAEVLLLNCPLRASLGLKCSATRISVPPNTPSGYTAVVSAALPDLADYIERNKTI